jgi:hypothetical protein
MSGASALTADDGDSDTEEAADIPTVTAGA